MASTTYEKDGVINILAGASFLGGGGGGALSLGLQMIDTLEKGGYPIKVVIDPVQDIPETELLATVAGLGAPSNVVMSKFEKDLPGSFAALKEAYRVQGKLLSGVFSGEMGGLNTMVAIMLHIVSASAGERVRLVDADGNGRAVPELNTCLVTARNHPPTPVGIEGHAVGSAEIENRYVAWTEKNGAETSEDIAKRAESIARSLAIEYGQVGFSTWAMSPQDILNDACDGILTKSHDIGAVLNDGAPWDSSKLGKITGLLEKKARQLCVGTVQSFSRNMAGGFDVGRTTILGDDGRTWNIDFQNENIVAYDSANTAVITAPERITILDASACVALTNVETDITAGRNVAVILSAADPKWWSPDMSAFRCWDPILDRVAYPGDYIDFNGQAFPRRQATC
jgi:DUF917 family protein